MTTDFSSACEILGHFYINYREDKEVKDFIDFNDIGLPLAYLTNENLCEINEDGKKFISETWDLFIAFLGIEDSGFDTLNEVLEKANKQF